MLNVI